jgi:hypothetical protein
MSLGSACLSRYLNSLTSIGSGLAFTRRIQATKSAAGASRPFDSKPLEKRDVV